MRLRDKISGAFVVAGLAGSIVSAPFALTYGSKRLYRTLRPAPKIVQLNNISKRAYSLNSIEKEIAKIENETKDMSMPLDLGDYHATFQKGKDALQEEYDKLILEKEFLNEKKIREHYEKKADFWGGILALSVFSLFGGVGIAVSGEQDKKEGYNGRYCNGGGSGPAG